MRKYARAIFYSLVGPVAIVAAIVGYCNEPGATGIAGYTIALVFGLVVSVMAYREWRKLRK